MQSSQFLLTTTGSLSPPPGPGLGTASAVSHVPLPPRPTGSGSVILGKRLVVPGTLVGIPPKANQPGTPREFMDSRRPRNVLKWSPKYCIVCIYAFS